MDFNSYSYIFAFLPLCVLVYFFLQSRNWNAAAQGWLAFASFFFYGYGRLSSFYGIAFSVCVNYWVARFLSGSSVNVSERKAWVACGIVFNVLFLCCFKYTGFLSGVIDATAVIMSPALNIALPAGLSFITFQQIVYLVNCYREPGQQANFLTYCLYISFFPRLLQGPIIYYQELMPQFAMERNRFFNVENFSKGIYLFSLGLFKKAVVGDWFASVVAKGFSQPDMLGLADSWLTSLGYTLQIYFDFSGYTDMALGAALMFNICLPQNFNSPYKAINIQDFWRRWHMTFVRFMRDFVYIPLGGNRRTDLITFRNLLLVFLVGGIWHGSGWTFIVWGLMHGAAVVVHRIWKKYGIPMPKALAWLLTFNYVNICWVFFRSRSLQDAFSVLKGMTGFNSLELENVPGILSPKTLVMTLLCFVAVIVFKNSAHMMQNFEPGVRAGVFSSVLFVVGVFFLTRTTGFIYYQF